MSMRLLLIGDQFGVILIPNIHPQEGRQLLSFFPDLQFAIVIEDMDAVFIAQN